MVLDKIYYFLKELFFPSTKTIGALKTFISGEV